MRAAIGLGWAAICGHKGACGQPTVPANLPLLLCRLSGYIFDEKVSIARTYLEPQASSCVDLLASSYCDSLLASSCAHWLASGWSFACKLLCLFAPTGSCAWQSCLGTGLRGCLWEQPNLLFGNPS